LESFSSFHKILRQKIESNEKLGADALRLFLNVPEAAKHISEKQQRK